jgi:hypothetical protein
MARRQIVMVRLLEPMLCLDCRFAQMADVEQQDGTEVRTVFCRRLDCDNWDRGSSEPIRKVHLDGEAEARTQD